MSFASLGLSAQILKAVASKGYDTPSPIQAQAIPAVLEGKDVMAAAQTGTGKTAGFTLPLLEILSKGTKAPAKQVRALVLTPTRELAAQVGESVEVYGKNLPLKSAVIFGGVGIGPQISKLSRGVDILVATPGRLLDLYNQRAVNFSQLEVLVLDEADRMLDMGFIHDIKKIIAALPAKRQNLMFSATFSDDIRKLAKGLVNNPVEISVTPRNATANTVTQWICPVDKGQKAAVLVQLIKQNDWQQVLVFSRTKHGANRLAKSLEAKGITAAAIHGNKSQGARTKALAEFKNGDVRILVATDIAARGLDIDQLPQVVNFDLPNVPEDYVHRIGRTGRAGATGQAVSLVSDDEVKLLRDIELLIKQNLERRVIEGLEPTHTLPETDLTGKSHGQNKGPRNSSPRGTNQRRSNSSAKPANRSQQDGAGKVEHKDGQRSGEAARGHKPTDKNPRHSRSSKPGSAPLSGQRRSRRSENSPQG
ncbi:ATP-dependent RNA helicase [Shewanella sp. Choline-02u-19]|uniref:DEAD/DEAH box helicase n=1 Tax=unclassified Shewanella TaxID=196818 RepID=UPI000C348692|nr:MULTISPECIES: DEAD/DEAH box helicase [unclassified Shewanella]PKG76527.1 ATP-dependent RNA helicase [Shewanella sp. GutCb]PKH55425.1 ATP-dependent RNA helicase [Shewanella sp. Bg11-22]PKI28772.1 ATP-dependent RNA helicase [Shewanella sp. Choline-02u-19]